MYPIKSRYPIAQRPQPQQTGFGSGMGELAMLIHQLQSLKQELLTMVNSKLKEVDEKVKDHVNTGEMIKDLHKRALGHIQTVKQGEKGKDADEEKITKKLEAKLPAPVDEDKLVERVLTKIPPVDEDKLSRKIIKSLPEHKADLRIIQEQFTTNPMDVIDKILELSKNGKFKLKTENIDGLEQTIAAFRHQITTKGYIHGGGDTVGAGTNVTITTVNGTKIINASGGGGFTILNTASAVNNSNQTFVFSTATAQPTFVVLDGVYFTALDSNGLTSKFKYSFSAFVRCDVFLLYCSISIC